MSGLIAYFADHVGKKLGKKRLSVFGLRPRHTAAAGTVLVGIVISTFTIAAVLIISSDMRQSLLEGAKIRRELAGYQVDLKKLDGEMKNRARQNADLTRNNGKLTQTITQKTIELSKRQADLSNAQATLTKLNLKIGDLQSRIDALQDDVAKKRTALSDSDRNLRTANNSLNRVRKELKNNELSLRNMQKEVSGIEDKNAELYSMNDDLVRKQKSLSADLDRIQKDVTDLQKAKETAQTDLVRSQDELKGVQRQLSDEESKLTSTREQLHDAELKYEQYFFISGVSRNQPMIFKIGEEVVRLAVPARLSVNAARGAITNLLRRALYEARRRGAKKHAYAEAAIVDHTDPLTNQTINPDMIEDGIVRQIAGSTVDKVLIATSSLNAFYGESVSLEVSVLPDPLVYRSGDLVAEKVIDGNQSDAAIYEQIREFLEVTVKGSAQKKGMIPVANGDVSFGDVQPADLFQIIAQLHNANRTIRLQAHANGDTRAADPLKLEFRLR